MTLTLTTTVYVSRPLTNLVVPVMGKLTLRGAPLETADVAVLLLHGRGDSAQGILGLADMLKTKGVAYAAPEAERERLVPAAVFATFRAQRAATFRGASNRRGRACRTLRRRVCTRKRCADGVFAGGVSGFRVHCQKRHALRRRRSTFRRTYRAGQPASTLRPGAYRTVIPAL